MGGLLTLSTTVLLTQSYVESEAVFPRNVAYAPGKANSSAHGVVVIVGDSTLDGSGSTQGSVESTLAQELGTTIINNAVAGSSLDDVYNSQPSCSCYSQCKWSVITVGMVDNTGGSRTMSSFISRELAAGKQVVIQGQPTPLQGIPVYYTNLMDSYAELAAANPKVWFSDARSQEIWNYPDAALFFAEDRSHPSPLGGAELARSIAKVVKTHPVGDEMLPSDSSMAHCGVDSGVAPLPPGDNLGVYSDNACTSLVSSIRLESDFCQKGQLQCMGPLAFLNSEGSVQKQVSIRYRIAAVNANVSRFDLERYWSAGCNGEPSASFNTGSTEETNKLFTLQCARAFEYPTSGTVYLRFEGLPVDCSLYHGILMHKPMTTTTTTTTRTHLGECAYEDAFLHAFKLVAGRLGIRGEHEKYQHPAIGGLLNYPTDIALDSMKQVKHQPLVKTYSTELPAHGAIVMPPRPSLTPYGPFVASYGMVVMPPSPLVLPPRLQETPDAAVVMPDGTVADPQPYVMVPGDVERPGPQTMPYAAVVMPAGSPDSSMSAYGSVVMPAGVQATPPGAQILSYGADVRPAGLPAMPRWAHVMPPSASYGAHGVDGDNLANLILPGMKPLPLANIVEPGMPVVVPKSYDPREKPGGAQQVFIVDSANHAIRLVNLTTGVMSTVAGHVGAYGSSGDGGPATSAYLMSPRGVALDVTARTLYVADYGNHAIRRIDLTTGKIQTVAGVLQDSAATEHTGPATSTHLSFPMGLALNAAGTHLYISDSGNHVIRELDLKLQRISTIAGTLGARGSAGDGGPASSAQLSTPVSLALDETSKKLYISDLYNHAVRVLDFTAGSLTTVAGMLGIRGSSGDGAPDGPAVHSELNHPTGLALDQAGKVLYIAESSNFGVRRLDLTTGTANNMIMRTVSSRPGFLGQSQDGGPLGLAFDPLTKELYAAEAFNNAVQVVDVANTIPHDDPSCATSAKPESVTHWRVPNLSPA